MFTNHDRFITLWNFLSFMQIKFGRFLKRKILKFVLQEWRIILTT